MLSSILRSEYSACGAVLKKTPTLLFSVLVLSIVSMNLFANKELIRTSFVALDCGFCFSWIPFLIMDAICRAYGVKDAIRLSVMALGLNLLLFVLFKGVSLLPGMWGEYYQTLNPIVNGALNSTLGGSVWIIFCSALAMAISSCVNSVVNCFIAIFLKKDTFSSFALRSFPSTLVAQFVDNMVFALLVSVHLFSWNMRQVLLCSLCAALFELFLEIVFSSLGYKLSKKLGD